MSTRTRASREAAILHHVVALDLGGGGYFLYSDVGFTTSDGIVIRPGLNAPDVVASLEGGGDSVSLSILSPETWAALVRGLDGAAAELSELAEGDSWGQRTSLMRGYLDSPTYGAAEEEVSASLASFVWEDSGQIPRPTWKIGAETWPRASSALACPSDLYGPYYPVVLGSPAIQRSAAEDLDWYPIPALIVEIDDSVDPPDNSALDCVILLGWGHLDCVGANIEIYNENTGSGAVVAAEATRDLLGQPCTVATVAAGDMAITLGDSLWWRPVAGEKCGIPGTGGCGGALRWLASWASVPLDADGWSAINDLDRLAFAMVLNEPVSPWGWIQDGPLRLLPCWPVEGPQGIGLATMPIGLQASDAEEIDVDALGGWREDPVQTRSWRELRPSYVLNYAPDVRQGSMRRRIVFDPDVSAPTATVCDTAFGRNVVGRYPQISRSVEEVSADWIGDAGTAAAIASYSHRMLTELWEEITVVLPQEILLTPGQLVSLTVADLADCGRWTDRICYVRSAPRVSGPAKYTFRTIEVD